MTKAQQLQRTQVRTSPMTGIIYIARFAEQSGKEALDKREAEPEVITAVIDHMMFDAPKGSSKDVFIGDKEYTITVIPKETNTNADSQ